MKSFIALTTSIALLAATAVAEELPQGCYVAYESPFKCVEFNQRSGLAWRTYKVTSEGVEQYGPAMQFVLETFDRVVRGNAREIRRLKRIINRGKR